MNKKIAFLFTLVISLFLTVKVFADDKPKGDSIKIKGFHIDLRIQPMQMPALKKFVAGLAANGINTIIMEWEGTYPYAAEPVISNRYAYSREEVRQFIAYCHHLKLDVIPLQQSFGHVEYILRNYKFAELREDKSDLSQVCPSKLEQDKALFTSLYKDMLQLDDSPYIHIGGDETHLLGHCEICRKKAQKVGLSRLYFDYIKMLCETVVSLGKRPLVWADMALKYPEYINELPKQTIFVDWNYGWDNDRFGAHEKLINSGYEIWGAPAIRSGPDNYFLTCWQNHFNNIRNFIPDCRKMGYKGVVMTSWSTSGVYMPVAESDNDLFDLYPVRHVYPIGGFQILVSAYTRALNDTVPLDVNRFISNYSRARYGFTAAQVKTFRSALFSTPYKVVSGKVLSPVPMTLAQLIDSTKISAANLRSLRPKSHTFEFDHYILMADIRLFYLEVEAAESELNKNKLNTTNVRLRAGRLQQLSAESRSLDARFNELNKGTLDPGSIREENEIRNYKLKYLYNKIEKNR